MEQARVLLNNRVGSDYLGGKYLGFFLMYNIQRCFICRHSDSTVSEDAGIEPRTVALASTALAVLPLG
jgi:hypothetical protein